MISPISQITYDLIVQKWSKTINNPGMFSLDIWYPIGGANMRIKQFLLDEIKQKKYIQNADTKLIYVDLAESQGIFAQDIIEQIAFALHISSSVGKWLQKNQQPITFFILGLDSSIRNGISQGVEYLQSLTEQYSLISCILFTEIDIPSFGKSFPNTSYQPLYSIDDALQFYKYLEEKWNFSIPAGLAMQLAEHVGGHFLLLKEAARLIRVNPKIADEEILLAPSMQQKGLAIFQHLSENDRKTMLNIFQGKPATPSLYLEKTKLVASGRSGIAYWYTIQDKLLSSQPKQENFDYVLTAPEREVFELLSEKGSVVSRDIIAQTLWQNDWENKYSDWAIDQLIHRIREKIKKTHAPFGIVTKKGEGFYLKNDTK